MSSASSYCLRCSAGTPRASSGAKGLGRSVGDFLFRHHSALLLEIPISTSISSSNARFLPATKRRYPSGSTHAPAPCVSASCACLPGHTARCEGEPDVRLPSVVCAAIIVDRMNLSWAESRKAGRDPPLRPGDAGPLAAQVEARDQAIGTGILVELEHIDRVAGVGDFEAHAAREFVTPDHGANDVVVRPADDLA